MPRATAARERSAAPVRVIDPNAVFRLDELRAVLGLPRTTLKREVRAGRLRVTRRAGCYWVLGSWLLEYFESGPGPSGHAGRLKTGTEARA